MGGTLGFGSSDFWVDKWSLSARWVRGGKEGVSPEPSPVPGPSPVDSSSPSRGLHAYAALKAQDLWGREGSGGTLAGFFAAAGWAWEWLTCLFSSGSFCRIILAPFSMPHMGKTECVPYKYYGGGRGGELWLSLIFFSTVPLISVPTKGLFLFLKPSSVLKKLGF